MLEKEREMYQAFADTIGLNLPLTADIIDGFEQVDEDLATRLAKLTDTKAHVWMAKGQGPLRQVSVRLWWMKQGRIGMIDVSEAWFADEPETEACK